MEKAIIVRSDGKLQVVEFQFGESYKVIKDAVDGYIECVAFTPTLDMWVNEEGKVYQLPRNDFATQLYTEKFGAVDYIAGDVIFTGGIDEDGETLGLDEETLKTFFSILN